MATVRTPVQGFNGVVVGVTFTDGVGQTDDPAALAYFARQGHTVEADEKSGGLPAESAKKEVWVEYVTALGGDVPENATKADLIALADTLTPTGPDNTSDGNSGEGEDPTE